MNERALAERVEGLERRVRVLEETRDVFFFMLMELERLLREIVAENIRRGEGQSR